MPLSCAWIASAVMRPPAMASIAVAGPVRQSPQTKTSSWLVERSVLGSASGVPHLVSFRPSPSKPSQRTFWPIAAITESTSISFSEPGTGSGLRRPLASGAPSCMVTLRMFIRLPEAEKLTGAVRKRIFTPSSSASCISSGLAGISALPRR